MLALSGAGLRTKFVAITKIGRLKKKPKKLLSKFDFMVSKRTEKLPALWQVILPQILEKSYFQIAKFWLKIRICFNNMLEPSFLVKISVLLKDHKSILGRDA